MWTWRKGFVVVLVVMITITGLLYNAYNKRFTMLSGVLAKVKTSATVSAASFGEIHQSQIVSLHTQLDTSTTNKCFEKKMFQGNRYVTEEEALKDPPLDDIQMTVNVTRSSVKLKGRYYNTGDCIELQIKLRDGMGIARTRGGDSLRIRMYNTNHTTYIAGHMTDHGNGSYTATVPAIWPGNQTISVFLAYTREAIRAIYYIRKQIPGTRGIAAIFNNGSHTEETICHAERHWLTNYSDICNLTRDNGGMSWYCGKPKNKLLSCHDWSFTKYTSSLPVLPLTKAEEQMLKQNWEFFPNFEIEVKGTLYERMNLSSCYSYPRQLLWNRSEPTGFFYNNEWHLLHCQQPNRSDYTQCLRGKHLMISGDSTTRQWYSFLMNFFSCKQTSERWTTEKWHRKSKCIVPSMNLTIEWIPHAQPFMPVKDWDMHQYAINCIAKDIEDIGEKQNVIFVIHMHMHFTAFHHSIFQDRMRHISNSVRNILMKNNNVTFMIKGPHTYKIPDLRGLNDYFGYVYKDIMFKAFEGLHDKIVFMDQADMTTAKGLVKNHPPEDVVKEAVFQMFDYICK